MCLCVRALARACVYVCVTGTRSSVKVQQYSEVIYIEPYFRLYLSVNALYTRVMSPTKI